MMEFGKLMEDGSVHTSHKPKDGYVSTDKFESKNGLLYGYYLKPNESGFHFKDGVAISKIENKALLGEINKAIQKHLDFEAKMLGYDDINSIGKFLGYENDYRVQCEALGILSASTWKYTEEQEEQVMLGNREIPTPNEAVQEAKDNVSFDYYEIS